MTKNLLGVRSNNILTAKQVYYKVVQVDTKKIELISNAKLLAKI